MNNLVFVMYNLKLEDRQRRKVVDTTIEDLPSNNEWIVDQEDNSLNEGLLNVLSLTKDKEIVVDDSVEEVSAFKAIEAEMGVAMSKDLALEDMDVNISESDHDIDNNDEDENGDDGDGNGEDDDCSDDNREVNDLL